MTTPRPIRIFDTTLRDGEQSPGASMNLNEKLEVAQALVQLGVDVIEAGFPIASPGDFESVREIAKIVKGSAVCGLARCNDADIDRAWEALKHAAQPRIHVFLATSSIHREFKLRMNEDEVRRLLGKPGDIAQYPLKPKTVWSWRWLEDGVNTDAFFNVHFGPDGLVYTTSRSDILKGR